MPRAARFVVPEVAHHVVQRGNRGQRIFFDDEDRRAYVSMLSNALKKYGTRCLAWCLMDNHVHLVLVPGDRDGLRAPLASAHTNYAQTINRKQGVSGHLFQGRFASYPMDDAHLMVAVRYVENNPVKAGMVERAADWPWSSAAAHVAGVRDGLTDIDALRRHVANWAAMLAHGLEASDQIDQALGTGRPLGSADWLATVAADLGRSLDPPKRGRPPQLPVK